MTGKRSALKAAAEPVQAPADVAGIHRRAKDEAVRQAAERRANAFPPFASSVDVSADTYGWRHGGASVVKDAGPARDGERRITLERTAGGHKGERIEVRRSRVWATRDKN